MVQKEQVSKFMEIFSDKFFSSKARLEQKQKVRSAIERFGRFKEEQMRILIENALERMENKEFHCDRTMNECAFIGARILADELLSNLKNEYENEE